MDSIYFVFSGVSGFSVMKLSMKVTKNVSLHVMLCTEGTRTQNLSFQLNKCNLSFAQFRLPPPALS